VADIDISGSLPELPDGVISGSSEISAAKLSAFTMPSDITSRSTYLIPNVPMDAPKATIEFHGAPGGSGAAHWAPEPPTPYEARRDALNAAATYCSAGGWGGPAAVIGVARDFEKFLKEAL
jgi:hypothetical protein